jgi:NADPH:quinone reductase-like Zn-dependent oxidoreductase
MSAYTIRAGVGIEGLTLTNIPPRALAPHEVRVRVHAVSLNYRDIMVAKGTYPVTSDGPVVPTSDGAGEIIEVGTAVTRFKTGDRVITTFFPGWVDGEPTAAKTSSPFGAGADGLLAKEVALNEEALVAIPADLSYSEAATLSCAGLTAWTTFFWEAKLKPGDSVLLLGTGGVSIAALQIAKAAGLYSIITSSSDEKLARAKALGANATINYRTTPDWQAEVLKLTDGRGVDLVLEVGGTDTLAQSVNSTRMGGSVAIIGGVSGFGGELQPFSLIGGKRKLLGIYVGPRKALEELVDFVALNNIKPIVDREFPFSQAREAYAFLEAGQHFGKVVINVSV